MVGNSLFFSITALALADSVNPCALAVLLIVLITILTKNPDKRYKVLTAGFSFISAVFIGYLIYAVIIIQLFTTMSAYMRDFGVYLYNGLAILAMFIGALNIRDYFNYKPGNIGSEMPLIFRPKVKQLINGITSVKGAFIIGIFVTLFLLPCTAGPLFVASGLLTEMGLIKALPWLLYYNFLFVLPMIIIIGIVYYGFKKVDEISGWKERNIRYLHLISGILLFGIGFALLMKWI